MSEVAEAVSSEPVGGDAPVETVSKHESIADEITSAMYPDINGVPEVSPEPEASKSEPITPDELESDEDLFPSKKEEEDVPDWKKGINKLRDENKELKAKLAQIEQAQNKEPQPEKYAPEDLKGAIQKGIEENDPNLIYSVFEYMQKDLKESLVKEYENDKNQSVQQKQAIQQEWEGVLESNKAMIQTELYPNSQTELNLNNPNSLLYQLADAYMKEYPERYHRQGGMKDAVHDAFTQIISKKIKSAKDSGNEALERKLQKEKLKTSLGSGADVIPQETSNSSAKEVDPLDDYISERKKQKEARMSGGY